jgi:hypothetical protein
LVTDKTNKEDIGNYEIVWELDGEIKDLYYYKDLCKMEMENVEFNYQLLFLNK